MNPRLLADITQRLTADMGFKPSQDKQWLQKGLCPSCKEKSLFTHAEHPWVLRCQRSNKCGAEIHVKDHWPDLFNSWTERYPATETNPNAAAEGYLTDGRGFELARVKGLFTQESYYSHELKIGSTTVRFPLAGGAYWERIIDRPERFDRKANFKGSYRGTWWQAPNVVKPGMKRLWLVEGIFDALALLHHDTPAVSLMTCNNYPELALKALAEQCGSGARPELVFALDGDGAGARYTKRWVEQAREQGWEAIAAQIPQEPGKKWDWNELHQNDRLNARTLDNALYHGALLMARTPQARGNLMFSHTGHNAFHFVFENRMYWFKLDLEAFGETKDKIAEAEPDLDEDAVREKALAQSKCVSEICNAHPQPLYYLKNELTDEAWYYFRVSFPHDAPPIKGNFTAGQLTAKSEFKKRLLHMASGAIWSGTDGQLDYLLRRWTEGIKNVQTIDFVGYSLEHQCYVFNDVAIAGSQVVRVNDEDYFQIGKLAIKSLSKSTRLAINFKADDKPEEWFRRLYLCYGPRGVIMLAYWLGSLFAEQIRDRFESFPFIELVGEPGSGKTTLMETLWKLLGRAGYEGFDPQKGSSVGFLRSMAQVSNLPVVLIESDRSDEGDGSRGRPKQTFHWDSLKSLFNGGSLRTTGVKSSGNDTYDPQFRGALVISQNAPVQASPAIMERIIHVWLDKSRQSNEGREAALELARMDAAQMSAFLVRATTNEAIVLDAMDKRLRPYELRLQEAGARNQRIQKSYGQLMVCIDALSLVCPITDSQKAEAKAELTAMALEREKSLQLDAPMVQEFWELYDYIEGDMGAEEYAPVLNHSRNPGQIAINLNHLEQVCADRRLKMPLLSDLKRVLKTSRERKFVDVKTVNSLIAETYNRRREAHQRPMASTVKCWVFEA